MKPEYLIAAIDVEAAAVDAALRRNPSLAPFYAHAFPEGSMFELRAAYLLLLKMTADYVAYSVPMLRAAGEALRQGSAEDRVWSERFLAYAADETDDRRSQGHQAWAVDDMRALDISDSFISAPPHSCVGVYASYLVEDARLHPYAILGTKGVLEHLSIRNADALVEGVVASGIDHARDAVSFFRRHGVLDIEHVQSGDRNLERIDDPKALRQVLEGAYFTGGCYRQMLHCYLA